MKKAAVTFASLFLAAALATASAKTYTLELFVPSVVAGTELKAGTYRIDVMDSSVVIQRGSTQITVPAKLEKADTKYPATKVRYDVTDGKNTIRQIHLGKTNLNLVLDSGASDAGTAAGQAIH
jgi:hypothetical protein